MGRVSYSPPKHPLTVCPFTGEDLEIQELPIGPVEGSTMFRAKGRFWCTSLYEDRDALLYDISQRDGRAPGFPRRRRPKVEVVGEREPPPSDPTEGLHRELPDETREAIDKVAPRLADAAKEYHR